MPTLETLSLADVPGAQSPSDLRLAYGYVQQVLNPTRSGQTLTALVRGGSLYEVEVTAAPDAILSRCTCSWGGQCKHANALLLKWLQSPEAFGASDPYVSAAGSRLQVVAVEPPPTRRPDNPPDWLAAPFAARQEGYHQELAEALERIRLQDLRAMARRRGWRISGTEKAAIVRQVAEHLARPDSALEAALGLEREHLQVLSAMILLGGGAREEDTARLAGGWGKLTQGRQVSAYTGRLCALGLAVPASAADGYGSYGTHCPDLVARSVLPALHPVLRPSRVFQAGESGPPGTPHALEASPASGELRLANPYPFVRAASQIALLLEQSPVPLRTPMPRPLLEKQMPGLRGWDYDPDELARTAKNSKLQPYADLILTVPPPRRSLPDEAIARLAPVAGGEARLEFIYSLLVAVGVCQPGSPVTIWPEVRAELLRQDELAQRAILAQAYFRLTDWSELWEMWRTGGRGALQIKRHAGYPYYTADRLGADLANCRLLVLRALACLPDGEWIPLDDLFRLLRQVWPRFDETVRRGPTYYGPANGWFLARAGGDERFTPVDTADWELAQGSFVREMLAGPLHWLGLADLSLERGALRAFRLHGLADLYWDRAEAPPAAHHALPQASAADESAQAAVTVEGERISIRPSAVSAQAHSVLGRIARLVAADAEHFEYYLDAQATYASFQAGVALAEILTDWQRLLGIAIPEAMLAQLTRWWEAYGRVRIYEQLAVVEFADDYALAEMKAVTSLEGHLIAEISPRLVLVKAEAVETLVEELERSGYTPKRTDRV